MSKESVVVTSFEDILDNGRYTFLQFLVVFIAFLLMVLDGFDITSMSFVAHRVIEDLSISPANFGLVFSIALAGMMLGAMFLAPLSDRVGRRKVLMWSIAGIGVSMILTGFTQNLWQLILVRIITGLGVGAMLANLTALTTEYTPTKYRSFCVSIIAAGFPMGATLGGFLVAPVLPEYGWQFVFFALGSVTLLMLFVVYWAMPESLQFLQTVNNEASLKKANNILTKMQRETLAQFAVSTIDDKNKGSVKSLLTPKWRTKTLSLWATFFFVFVSLYFLMSWLPKLVVAAGFDEQQGVFSAVALNGGGVIGTILLGWFASRATLTHLISAFFLLSAIFMFAFGPLFEFFNLFIVLFTLGFFLQGGYVGLYSASAKLYPTEFRATGIGWALGLGRIGAVIGPYIGGLLISQNVGLQMNFMLFAIPLVFATLLAFKLQIK